MWNPGVELTLASDEAESGAGTTTDTQHDSLAADSKLFLIAEGKEAHGEEIL